MIVTEETAKQQMLCPLVQVSKSVGEIETTGPGYCWGSACMMWVQIDTATFKPDAERRGTCGLIHQTQKT